MIYFFTFLNQILCLFLYQFCNEINFRIILQVREFGSILNDGTGSDYSQQGIIYNIFSYLFFPLEFVKQFKFNFISEY